MFSRALIGGLLFFASVAPGSAQLSPAEGAQDLTVIIRDLNTALENAAQGAEARWSNPDSGHRGTITPLWTFVSRAGAPCRHYRRTWESGFQTIQYEGAACRMSARNWRVQNETIVGDSRQGQSISKVSPPWVPPEVLAEDEAVLGGLDGAARSVAIAQRDLQRLGYDPGPIDGVAGRKTVKAVTKFQADRSIPVTGRVNADLLSGLRAALDLTRRNPVADRPPESSLVLEPARKITSPAKAAMVPAAAESASLVPPGKGVEVSKLTGNSGAFPDSLSVGNSKLTGEPIVQEAQRHLRTLGYAPGRVDGLSDPRTIGAVLRFQRDNDLEMTGRLTLDLMDDLRQAVAKPKGPPLAAPVPGESELIIAIQRRLRDLGYDPGSLDGIAGRKTRGAATAFQKDQGLPETGRLDEALYADLSLEHRARVGGAIADTGAEAPEPAVKTLKNYLDHTSEAPSIAAKVPDLILDNTRQGSEN